MSGLPLGWESDYDGQRWFYTYKPSGHIQYHFPSEGDEFPDFIDSSTPAPDLAPEERLESQQQVRRQTSTTGAGAPAVRNGASKPNKPLMSATAQPVSFVWEADEEADEDEGEQVFQPESFMFLGPGTYADVSPLNEEEEEAAKRVVAGGIGERFEGGGLGVGGKGVSPVASGKTTPMVPKSEPSVSPGQGESAAATSAPAIESLPVMSEPVHPAPVSPPVTESQPTIHMIDGREMPHELPVEIQPPPPLPVFDPVGIVAEMPTEHTAVAHIELHPDPVEMGDNSILAPIETAAPHGQAPTQPPEEKPELFKIARKPTGDIGRQPAYQAYAPGQEDAAAATQPTDRRRSNAGSLQREVSLMLGSGTDSAASFDPSTVPSVLSPAQMPPKASMGGTVQQRTPRKGAPVHAIHSGPRQGTSEGKVSDQGLSHVPSVLQPAKNGQNRNSLQAPPQPAVTIKPQPAPVLENQASQRPQSQGVLSNVPSILKPVRGKGATSTPEQQAPRIPTSVTVPGQTDPNGDARGQGHISPKPTGHPTSMTPGPGQQPSRPGVQRVTTVPCTLPSQDPPAGAQAYMSYQGPSGGQAAPQGPWQIQQPSRPASAMPTIGRLQQSAPNQWPGYQQMHPSNAYGQPPPRAPLHGQVQQPQAGQPQRQFQQMHNVQSAQPGRSQSAMGNTSPRQLQQMQNVQPTQPGRSQSAIGNPSPQQYPPANHPHGVAGPQPQSVPVNRTPPLQGVRRASTFSPGDVSPIRSRPESQSSGHPLQTPSPMETFRRNSSNPSIAQSVNGTGYTPSPSNGTSGPAPHATTQGGVQGTPGPPVPTKVPLQHAAGSFFPVQNPSQSRSQPAGPPGQTQQSPPAWPLQHTSNEHPIGFQATMTSAARRPPAQSKPGPPPQNINAQQQSSEQSSEPPQPPPQGPATPTPAHLLGRIEEHDESEAVSEPNATSQGTRPSSIASSLQHSHSRRQSVQQPPAQGSAGPQPLATGAVPQGLGVPPQQGTNQQTQPQPAPGQALPQGQHPGQPLVGQPPQGQMPQGKMPQGQMQSQGPMPPGGFAPPGQPPFQQQAPWNVPMHPGAPPQDFRPGPAQPQGLSNPAGKEKEKKWAKWFKSPKSSQSPKPQQQSMQYTPGQMPAHGKPNQPPPQRTGGQYFQAPGWQPGQGPPPPGFQPGIPPQFAPGSQMGRRSMSDSASTSTVGSSVHSQQVMQQHQPGQAPGLGPQPIGNSQHSQPSPATPVVSNQPGPQGPGYHHAKSHSNACLPPQEQLRQLPTQGQQQPHPSQGPKPSPGQNLMPAPLFANPNTAAPNNNARPVTGNTNVHAWPQGQSPRGDRWAKNAAADYSGGDWGDEEGWQRR
ncbi:hypothetical protein TOPH_01459 [Tolypocladium ophioglossoides CBS 100239]|uniref:WW domain-containing protein n=1 Tax=Tolypocladium ophioglossoides (strain CBS 100239) TaxID=1163406 RepID=A0A0L0NI81_TOLOC|nr:hypothetical protein TOPH_01459 [Tolypocladium ophioglossoides CBS 100239]